MAPISNKRSQSQSQPHIKENSGGDHSHGHGHHTAHKMYTHTKENASTNKHNKKGRGLEILDFHESWLEEMEIYKDKLYVHKHSKQQQHQQQQPQHQLLGSHNHAHTMQGGCQFDPFGGGSISQHNTIASHLNALMTVATKSDITTSNTNTKRRSSAATAAAVVTEQNSNITSGGGATANSNGSGSIASGRSRIIIRNSVGTTAAAAAAASLETNKQNGNVQLLLKRQRDDASPSKSIATVGGINNTKRHASAYNVPIRSQSHLTTSQLVQSQSSQLSSSSPHSKNATMKTGSSTSGGSITGSSSSSKQANKIIVNQFHASSLLSGHQHDEKTKILSQNGLTKSAATAYETSLYASHYLPQDGRFCGPFNTARNPNGDYNNYMGVSLVKSDRESSTSTTEDDPGAAIDDVNSYTDSDSDDDYVGYPFFLDEDENQTHQSLNIRYQPERLVGGDDDSDADSERSDYYRPNSILTPSIFPNVPPYLNFSSHTEKGPAMPHSLHKVLKWKLSPVMPKIVKRVVLNSGFRIIKNTTDWMAVWEKHMKSPGFRTIRSHQKYNHMPGSFRIGRKDSMWRSIHNNMKKFGKKEFGFMQRSYIMPDDLESLRQVWPKNASKLTKWIVKPPASARGTGIRIVNKWSQFPKDRPLVVQKYIERPLLINDNKFDMRIYVVVTSINPLRIYMYKDGLARFASVKYSSELTTLDDRCMHLTNYSINKLSQNYSKNEDFNACQGHKWTLQSLWSCLEGRGINTKRLWATLRNLVIKAIISGESGLNRMYRQNVNFRYNCFELFGFDVLLDENIIPWLLEINISPSLHSELPLDLHVKGPLIQAVLNTALYQVPPKLGEKHQKDILDELKLDGPLCHDKRIFTTCLTAEEVRKHNQFTNRSIEFREEYLDAILEHLLPDDVRCLIIAEDEYARCKPLERIYPTPDTHIYLKFIDNPRYYNRLLDAWEHKFGHYREQGIALLTGFCEDGYHLQVSEAALEKEPNVTLTEIDMLHQKKSDDTIVGVPVAPANMYAPANANTNIGDSANVRDDHADDNVNAITPVQWSKEEHSPKATSKNQSTAKANTTVKVN